MEVMTGATMMLRALPFACAVLALAAQAGPKMALGTPMPAFALPGVDGKTLDSKSIKGPAVVVFLSTQCPYVLGSEDRINALAKAYAGKVTFVGINSNESESEARKDEGMAGMKAHAAKKAYAFAYLKDESQAVIKAYGGVCTPDFFLFDGAGRLVYRGRMDDNTTPKADAPITRHDLKEALDALLAGRPVNPDQKPSRGCSIKWKA
jgi:thiol-disulfide isomerase/thioredoxin